MSCSIYWEESDRRLCALRGGEGQPAVVTCGERGEGEEVRGVSRRAQCKWFWLQWTSNEIENEQKLLV